MYVCLCVVVFEGGGQRTVRQAGWEEVMQNDSVFAWKCEQWMDSVFSSSP